MQTHASSNGMAASRCADDDDDDDKALLLVWFWLLGLDNNAEAEAEVPRESDWSSTKSKRSRELEGRILVGWRFCGAEPRTLHAASQASERFEGR